MIIVNTFLLLTMVLGTVQSPFHMLIHSFLTTTYETGTITTPTLERNKLRTMAKATW